MMRMAGGDTPMLEAVPGMTAGVSVAEAQRLMAQAFRHAGIETPDADARLLLGHALGLDRARLLAESKRPLDADAMEQIQKLAARRLRREPVSRILGRKEFWSLMLRVSDAVLVPRPETETIVELALDLVARDGRQNEPLRILDIGTGSGALLLALLSELKSATGVGTDISLAAIAVARHNAEEHGLGARARMVCCNLAEGIEERFDLIVSNPPYIPHGDIAGLDPEVRDFDPGLALDGGADGLDIYRALAGAARRLLAPGGHLIVELGIGQEPGVASLFETGGLKVTPARPDLGGVARALAVTEESEIRHV